MCFVPALRERLLMCSLSLPLVDKERFFANFCLRLNSLEARTVFTAVLILLCFELPLPVA